MPLLKRRPYTVMKPPKDLKPNEEVFQVRFTKEIFRDYQYPVILFFWLQSFACMGCCAFSLNGSFDCFFSSLFWVLRFLSFGGRRRRCCHGLFDHRNFWFLVEFCASN